MPTYLGCSQGGHYTLGASGPLANKQTLKERKDQMALAHGDGGGGNTTRKGAI